MNVEIYDALAAAFVVGMLATVAAVGTVPWLWQQVRYWRARPAIKRRIDEYVAGKPRRESPTQSA